MARNSSDKHFCQSELQGTIKNRSFITGVVDFDILRSWKDFHVHTSEYTLQGKCKEEMTTATENGATCLIKIMLSKQSGQEGQ